METIKLDLVPGKKMPSLHASQYDDGRAYHIDLTEKNEPYKLDGTEVLTVNERKGDNCICSLDIENTFADKTYVEFASTLQMCAVAGANICELVIKRGNVTLGTLNFILEIEPSPTEGGIESESEISNLERQIEEITEQVIGDDYYTAEQTDEAIATAIDGKMDKANPTGTGRIAVGQGVVASGTNSQAFGVSSTASGNVSHAEGVLTTASGLFSHAEGQNTAASGEASHAEGYQTIASGRFQHVSGSYNVVDNNNTYAEIIGNGKNSYARSNARTLDWQGNETLAGDLTINGNQSVSGEITRLDGRIDNLPEAMVFKGTLGVNGDIQTLPTASAEIEGWTFKCITAGTYAGLTLKVGDTVTCFNPPNTSVYEWEKTGSQDTDTDTWRAIKVNGVEKLGNGISSGAVDFVGSDNIEVEFDANGNKVGVKTKNIYTKTEVDSIVSDAIYNVLPDDTASGSVANFNTSLALPIKSLEVDVNAVQESGTPTPSTPKAISGWNAITLDVNGTTEVINLGGTYYGGHLIQDKAGHRQFVVTHGIKLFGDISFSRSNNGGAWDAYLFYAQITDKTNGGVLKCSNYERVVQAIASMQNEKIVAVSTNKYIYIRDDAYTTVPDFKTANANTQLVYPLATPYMIDLPDGQPINTLAGVNNFYADTGDSTVVFKSSVSDYVSAHSGGNLLGMGGVYLGGAKSGGGEEEPDEGEDTEKVKLDETKEETKTIGDTKKLGGE